jgi:tRNA (guanine-N7-)-methyltransferase
MQRYQQIVKAGGIIHLKTDSPFLYTYTMEMLRLNPYPLLCSTEDLYSDYSDSIGQKASFEDARSLQTHYENQWLDRGLKIKYIEWQVVPLAHWEEPTTEIEHDSYRSYGRNYSSQQSKQ